LIASAASVLTVPEYYARVIPENQNFEKNNYAGILIKRSYFRNKIVKISNEKEINR
jgi:hypothetical protein